MCIARASYYDPYSTKFLSEDPKYLGGGDTNLYRYTLNQPITLKDPDGRQMVIRNSEREGANIAFFRNYLEMIWEGNVKGDKFFHCRANCEATKIGAEGELQAIRISDARESSDLSKGDTKEACAADQAANQYGRDQAKANPGKSCYEICFSKYKENGLTPYE